MTTSVITGVVKKHVYSTNGFDVFSILPLLNDQDTPVIVDPKYKTITIRGSEISHVSEGQIYTFNLEKLTDTEKYKNNYNPKLIVKAYPNTLDEQTEFLKNTTEYLKRSEKNITSTYFKFNSNKSLWIDPLDMVKSFVAYLKENGTHKQVQQLLNKLTPFSPIVKYLTERNVSYDDALSLANAKTISISDFKKSEENIFKLYYGGDVMPINQLIRVQTIIYPEADLTPANPYLLDSAIRYFLESNLFQTQDEYTPKEILINQLDSTFLGMYDWEIILSNYSPQSKSQVRVVKTDDNETIYVSSQVFNMTRILSKSFETAKLNSKTINEPLLNITQDYGVAIEPSEEQKDFIRKAIHNEITLLTGSAGTGKSQTIGTLIKILKSRDKKVRLLAPTAKAAQNLVAYSGEEAHTMDSFIGKASVMDLSTIDDDYIILDEMSMSDLTRGSKILKIVSNINILRSDDQNNNKVKIIWAGDVAQLLPVGFGAPFRDALHIYPSLTTQLTTVYRQSNPEVLDILTQARDGNFQVDDIYTADKYVRLTSKVAYKKFQSVTQVSHLIKHNLPQYTPEAFAEYGIISALNKVVTQLNIELQDKLNPHSHSSYVKRQLLLNQDEKFALGDPVILTRNTLFISADHIKDKFNISEITPTSILKLENQYTYYGSLALPESLCIQRYNGDPGYISKILSETCFIATIKTDSGEKELIMHTNHISISNIDLAYALTVHKAQGSQYRHVIFVNVKSRDSMSSKNLIYTALSRTKDDLVIFSNSKFSNIEEVRETLWPRILNQPFLKQLATTSQK